jgi:hypothetical protein
MYILLLLSSDINSPIARRQYRLIIDAIAGLKSSKE